MSESEAYAIANSIWRHWRKADGYQAFGYDWRTMRLQRPQQTAMLARCYNVLGMEGC
jgi:hypothetical protein